MDGFSLELRVMLIVCIMTLTISQFKCSHREPLCIQAGPQQKDNRSGRIRF